MEAQLAAIDGALAALTGKRVKQLQLITSSARHRERLAKHLRQQGAKEAKFKQCAAPVLIPSALPSLFRACAQALAPQRFVHDS